MILCIVALLLCAVYVSIEILYSINVQFICTCLQQRYYILLCLYAKSEEDLLQCLCLVTLHEEAWRLLGEQSAVPHDAHHVRVPRLLDVVCGDDDAHT